MDVDVPASQGQLPAYLALPTSPGPWPAVVVLHEIFGLTDDVRAQADRFAGHGYLALAPDLYGWGASARCMVATMRTMTTGRGRALDDVLAARDWLVERDDCSGKVAVVGFCMGGGLAVLLAPRGFDAAAPNYGPVPKDAEQAMRGSCPLVGSYGAKDPRLKDDPHRLRRALETLGVTHDIEVYDDAAHGFLYDHHGRWGWVERLPGLGHVPDAADDAWRRIFAFLDEHLVAT